MSMMKFLLKLFFPKLNLRLAALGLYELSTQTPRQNTADLTHSTLCVCVHEDVLELY